VGLREYDRKRDFERTPEPRGRRTKPARRGRAKSARTKRAPALQFVVQQHAARRMHWDFRLELDGVLKSWAVPKGPSLVAGQRRMAAQTEDHPLEYAGFEGVIPKGEYGGGTVVVWDRGFWQPIGDARRGLAAGKLDFALSGEKLRGRFHLVRMKPREGERERGRASWLLIKGRDAHARPAGARSVVESETRSVLTGRDLDDVARDADRVWSSRTGERGGGRAVGAPGDPAALSSSRREPLPEQVALQLATLVDAPPDGPEWLHEIKLDGYRILCRIERGAVRLVTRNGLDWTDRFPDLAAALAALPARTALLDGEAVVFDREGRTSFQALQGALGRKGSAAAVQFAAFDCLHLDGSDVRGAPLLERKQLLRALLSQQPDDPVVRFSDHVVGRGPEFHAAACARGVEGIVSKRIDAPYRSGRSRAWLKVRCSKRQEFVIAGFTDPGGSRTGLGALLLGARDAEGALRYCGKVGTGFDAATLSALRAKLDSLARERSALADPPRMRGVHWVAPKLVAEVSFTEWTADRRIRHPVFLGLREDKDQRDVRIEVEQPAAGAVRNTSNVVAGVSLSNPDRVYFADAGITKRELAAYYEAVAERVLPGLENRPLTLLRCPEGVEGECFYQKHVNRSISEAVARVRVRRGEEPYAMVNDLAALISLVQIGVLEFHVWGARADRLDRPDLCVFDIDPDTAVPWARVVETAVALRVLLEDLGLAAFARTTGGKGVHVVVPIARRATWDEVRDFSQGVARHLVRLAPDQFTAVMSKARRKGKIYIDWVRNTREATAIASWSTRARPGAPVAVPLAWDELESLSGPLRESVRDAPRRLARPDPWRHFEASRRPLSRAALDRVAE
jgi:bifunctional non-homologous end joining protein LigD